MPVQAQCQEETILTQLPVVFAAGMRRQCRQSISSIAGVWRESDDM
mgnify:CR=1 FL=1